MIDVLSNNFILFIDNIADGLADVFGGFKLFVLSHFFSCNYVCVVIKIIDEECKKQIRRNSNFWKLRADHKI